MEILNVEQNTPEWLQARAGIPTASSFNKIVDSKGNPSKQREKYLYECVGEVVSGEPKDSYSNGNMDRGHEREDEARNAYSLIHDTEVVQVGFVFLNADKQVGCSPDGLVGDDGLLELKDAAPHIHLDRLENGWSESQHKQQVQGQLYVCGRKWCDLQSYSRGFQPLVVRYERDEDFIKKLKIELAMFYNDMKSLIEKYSA